MDSVTLKLEGGFIATKQLPEGSVEELGVSKRAWVSLRECIETWGL